MLWGVPVEASLSAWSLVRLSPLMEFRVKLLLMCMRAINYRISLFPMIIWFPKLQLIPLSLVVYLQLRVTWQHSYRSATTTSPSCPSPRPCSRETLAPRPSRSCTMQLPSHPCTRWTRLIVCWGATTEPVRRYSCAHRFWARVASGCDATSTWRLKQDW